MTEETTNGNEEEWKSISGYMNYEVSSIGRIRNISTGKLLTPYSDSSGHLKVGIYNEQNRKKYLVHKLVAQEFVNNPDNKTYVDHVEHNRQNNCINNLRWCSKSENGMNMRKRKKTCSSCFKGVYWNKKSKWLAQIRINTVMQHIGHFSSEIDAARAYNEKAIELSGACANVNVL